MAGGNGRPVTHSPVLTWRDAAPVLLNMDKMTNELFQLGLRSTFINPVTPNN